MNKPSRSVWIPRAVLEQVEKLAAEQRRSVTQQVVLLVELGLAAGDDRVPGRKA